MLLPRKPRADDWDEEDDDDYDYYTNGPHVTEVFEAEEPDILVSPILGPDGQPIIYEYESEKLGYIGYIPPQMYLAIHEKQAKEKRRTRYARPRKSKT